MVDKTVATVSDGVRTELITYSDLLWELALQRNAPLDPPTSEHLNRALRMQIDQRLFALEAERLPPDPPSKDEINAEIQRVLNQFGSTAAFEARLRRVGFTTVSDDNFQEMMRRRVAIERYLAFRFRSFIVIPPDEVTKYYSEVFVPSFRREFPGVEVPSIEAKRADIYQILTEEKVAVVIERFLDDARKRTEIVILNEV